MKVQVFMFSRGIGDGILGLTSCEGLRQAGNHVTYCVPELVRPWVECFNGYDTLVTDPTADVDKSYSPFSSLMLTEIPEKGRLSRAQYYANYCDTTPALPEGSNIPTEALTWAEQYRDVVVLVPYAIYTARTYPLGHWLEVEKKLTGERVVILDTEAERCQWFTSEKIIKESPARVVALLSVAKGVIANDSGMAHVGGMLRTPTIALCGPMTGEKIYGIYPTVLPVDGWLECGGCWFQDIPRRCEEFCANLESIEPDEVVYSFHELLELLELKAQYRIEGTVCDLVSFLGEYIMD